MWPSVVVHEHWPVSQRMIVEMGNYAWGLMKVVFCYDLPTVVQGFGANETLHFRTTAFWAQLLLGVGLNLKLYTKKISFRSQTQMLKSARGTLHTLSYTHK
jgi:hypothetical protein